MCRGLIILYVYIIECVKRRERPIEEKQLIEKAQQGSEHAFRILVQTYRHYIFQVIFSILRHEEDAKDVTQEVFVKFTPLSLIINFAD